jgi:hypothetical protein
MVFIPDKLCEAILLAESIEPAVLMIPYPLPKIAGDTNVENTAHSVGDDVDGRLLFILHNRQNLFRIQRLLNKQVARLKRAMTVSGSEVEVGLPQRPCHLLHAEAFDHVIRAHVLIVLKRHAALCAADHFLHFVLEALKGGQHAFVDDDVVADQTHLGTALHFAFSDQAASNLANLGDVEDFQDAGVAEEGFAQFRCKLAGHRRFDVIDEIVDDVVVADLNALLLGRVTGLAIGADVEAENSSTRCSSERNI